HAGGQHARRGPLGPGEHQAQAPVYRRLTPLRGGPNFSPDGGQRPSMAKRVLVVDDSPTIRKIVEVCLNGAGVGFEGASGGAEAAASLSARLPDLVLADVVMPAPDGYELCELVKRKTYGKRIPVVLMADPFQPFDAEKAMAAGADGNIAKPFDARTLMDMISHQLGSKFKRRPAGGPGGGARRRAVGR